MQIARMKESKFLEIWNFRQRNQSSSQSLNNNKSVINWDENSVRCLYSMAKNMVLCLRIGLHENAEPDESILTIIN